MHQINEILTFIDNNFLIIWILLNILNFIVEKTKNEFDDDIVELLNQILKWVTVGKGNTKSIPKQGSKAVKEVVKKASKLKSILWT